MTREEAIQVLNMVEAYGLADEAKRMAIEALQADAEDRLYIKIYADDEPSVKAEKLYQICGETQPKEVTEWLKEYFPDMAIEALSAPQTDLISRADAIEAVLTYFIPRSHTGERGEHEEDFVRTIFKALPSAETHEKRTETHGVCSDLISRSDAIERIANDNVVGGMKRINEYRDSTEHNDYLDGISTAIATVDDLPSADAVHGEWIEHELWGNPWYTCSICNYHGRNDFNFCPNCGARNKGGDTE